MSVNDFTEYLSSVLRILLIQNPKITSMGFLCGMVLSFIIDATKALTGMMSVDFLSAWKLGLSGIFLFHLPSFLKKDDLPEEVEQQFRVIRIACRDGKVSDAQRRIMYQSVAANFIAKTSAKKSTEVTALDRPSA